MLDISKSTLYNNCVALSVSLGVNVEKNVRNGWLFSIYGFVLTETQQELMRAHYEEDLSLSEIAEERGISKQAVSTQLQRAVDKMEMMEAHLGVVRREADAQRPLEVIEQALEGLAPERADAAREALNALRVLLAEDSR